MIDREHNETVDMFLKDKIVITMVPSDKISAADMWYEYVTWCQTHGFGGNLIEAKRFSGAVMVNGILKKKFTNASKYIGIKLK